MKHYFVIVKSENSDTGFLLNENLELVKTFNDLWDSSGEFRDSFLKDFKFGPDVFRFANSLQDGIDNIRRDNDQVKRINEYLTPEKTEELLKLFR